MANANPEFDARSVRNADVAYEPRDLSSHAVFYFLVVLAVVIVFAYTGLWGMFKYLGSPEYAGHQTTNPIMTSQEQLKEIGGDPANSFPAPQLQPDDVADLNKFRIREEQRLNTYGWVDQTHGRIRIPIENAIDMMAASWLADEQSSATDAEKVPANTNQNSNVMTDERGGNYGW